MGLLRSLITPCLLRPRSVAVIDDQRTWRRIELLGYALHLAAAIEQATSAQRVGVMLPTSGLFPATAMATWMLGRTLVPLNYLLSRSDLDYIARNAELDTVVTVGPMLDLVGGAPQGTRPLRLEEVDRRGIPPLRWPRGLRTRELAVVLYTSGTSGRPKGVMLTAGNLAANMEQVRRRARFTRDEVMLGVLPQFHSFGLTILTLLPLSLSCTAVYSARFVPRRVVELARQHRATVFVALPSMYNALRTVRDATGEEFHTLRYAVSGGEPLPMSVSDAFYERFGVRISEGYGLTETAPVANWCMPEEYRAGSVGRPVDWVEERIVGPDGSDMPIGVDGEVRIHGPNVMAGYLGMPEETAAVFDERGFFRTGDMGRFDSDGHLRITGRIKEMLIISGENVFPREIEDAVRRHPSVKDAAVIGEPDDMRGEVPIAFVELRDGMSFDAAAIRATCRESLPPYKVPREVRCLAALPRNPTGKVLRRQLATAVSSGTVAPAGEQR